jgi:hypothetical protein
MTSRKDILLLVAVVCLAIGSIGRFNLTPTGYRPLDGEDVSQKYNQSSNVVTAHASTTRQSSKTSRRTECWTLNSPEWLKGPRWGNSDEGMEETFIRQMIVLAPGKLHQPFQFILNKTLSHATSRFLNESEGLLQDDKTIRMWAVRLVYLALHYHQHHWAIPEATLRLKRCPAQELQKQNVGLFDYECPNAKFMIIPLKAHGLGANIRTDVIPALLVALVSNRVAIFVNNAPAGNQDVRNPWPLASCPRGDHQCFFLPVSPCTLTVKDIDEAHVFENRVDFRRILKKGVLPKGFDDHKVWLFRHASGHTIQLPEGAVERLQNYSTLLLQSVPADDPRLFTLRRAVEAIAEKDPKREGLNYAMANLKVHHALAFYAMRPSLPSAIKLESILKDIIPVGFEPEHAIGLPVRGKWRTVL